MCGFVAPYLAQPFFLDLFKAFISLRVLASVIVAFLSHSFISRLLNYEVSSTIYEAELFCTEEFNIKHMVIDPINLFSVILSAPSWCIFIFTHSSVCAKKVGCKNVDFCETPFHSIKKQEHIHRCSCLTRSRQRNPTSNSVLKLCRS